MALVHSSARVNCSNPNFPWGRFLLFAACSVIVWRIQVNIKEFPAIGGVHVPDVLGMASTLESDAEGLNDSDWVRKQYLGILIIYKLFVGFGSGACLIPNLILIYITLKTYCSKFRLNRFAREGVVWGVLGNPYILLVTTGPNKEIPLLAVTGMAFFAFEKRAIPALVLLLACGLTAYSFRDGYGPVLFLSGVVAILARGRSARVGLFVVFALIFCAGMYWSVDLDLEFVRRNKAGAGSIADLYMGKGSTFLGVSIAGGHNFLYDALIYNMRCVYNVVTLAFFPSFLTASGGIFALGLSYWVYGVALLAGTVGCVSILMLKGARPLNTDSFATLVIIAALSVSSYVQPRYNMPLLPVQMAILFSLRKKAWAICTACIGGALIVILAYSLAGHPPARSQPVDQLEDIVAS